MKREGIGALLAALGFVAATQTAASAQEHRMLVPPVGTSGPGLIRPFATLDFGAPKPAPTPAPIFPQPRRTPGRHVPIAQHQLPLEWRGSSELATPIDCAMAKPGDPTVDPKLVRMPPAGIRHSGVILTVAPCAIRK